MQPCLPVGISLKQHCRSTFNTITINSLYISLLSHQLIEEHLNNLHFIPPQMNISIYATNLDFF